MKTPMQEMYDQLKASRKDEYGLAFAIDMLLEDEQAMLEKEKEAIMNAYDIGWSDGNKDQDLNDLYYFETFNTK
jgi:hypothetical protein